MRRRNSVAVEFRGDAAEAFAAGALGADAVDYVDGAKRYRVMYRVGGRESAPRYGGSFATRREAIVRKSWVVGELAANARSRRSPRD